MSRISFPTALAVLATAVSSSASAQGSTDFVGAVYAMTNDFSGNSIVAYGRNADGTLELIETQTTSGLGAAFDGGEGLDPLISAYALNITPDYEYVLAVNAGSNTITSLRVEDDFSLTETGRARSGGVGPNSIAIFGDLIYVSNIDADGVFAGEPDQEGSIAGFRLNAQGGLDPIPGSRRVLGNRPSAIEFSTDGRHLVVASINAGSAALASGSADELVVYGVRRNGRPTLAPVGTGASTLPGNAQNRNLPSAIGFDIVEQNGRQFVVVTEAREFTAAGAPPTLPGLQTGSVSTWLLENDGALTPINLDVMTGTDMLDGERTACWIQFSNDQSVFWVSNALEATLSSFSFDNGQISLLNRIEAAGTGPDATNPFGTTDGWIDLWSSDDGNYLYQLYGLDGTIGVFQVNGAGLTLIQEVQDLPDVNTQGIVAF